MKGYVWRVIEARVEDVWDGKRRFIISLFSLCVIST